MFGQPPEFQFAHGSFGHGENDWTPPWVQREGREGRGWHMQRGRGPRGPFGPEGPFGSHGPFGPHGPFGRGHEGGRFFGRGDVKFALLELLQERPMHGYEMMKAMEERSGGFYTPSPGSIYPTLQMLEDRGFVSVQEVEGKKVYSISDEGRKLLAEKGKEEGQFQGPPWMRGRAFWRRGAAPELQALRSEAMEVVRLLMIAGRMSFEEPQQLARLRGIVERARKELTDMIYGSNTPSGEATAFDAREAGWDGSPIEDV